MARNLLQSYGAFSLHHNLLTRWSLRLSGLPAGVGTKGEGAELALLHREAAMPLFVFFAAAGLVLLALLFVADATTSQVVVAAQPKSKTVANDASPSRDEMLRRLTGYGQNVPDRSSISGQYRGAEKHPDNK